MLRQEIDIFTSTARDGSLLSPQHVKVSREAEAESERDVFGLKKKIKKP